MVCFIGASISVFPLQQDIILLAKCSNFSCSLGVFSKDLISLNDGNTIWTVLERSSSSFKAGIGESTVIDATGKYKKLKGTKCIYAVTKYKNSSFVQEKCKIDDKIFNELKGE